MYMENPAQMDMVALIAMGLDQHRNTNVVKQVALVVGVPIVMDLRLNISVVALGQMDMVALVRVLIHLVEALVLTAAI